MRHQSDYYLEISEKDYIEYIKWNFGDIDYAFDLANDVFDSFENIK